MSVIRCLVRRDTYRDSVELMRLAALLEARAGVARAALLMGTPANRALMAEAGLAADEIAAARPGDLVVAVAAADAAAADAALAEAARLLASPAPSSPAAGGAPAPVSIAEAAAGLAGANLALISTPGDYATAEALKALKRGLHVFLFSDNVSVEDEIRLKTVAARKNLLVMGPDCGTAIVDGVPLGFANAVRRGAIGLAGASGTGLQEVSCLVDRLGEGVSQLIGVGSRDLDERIGGPMMVAAIEHLARDPGTRVIVLVSKPPAPAVARRVLAVARASGKPVVANFLGSDRGDLDGAGVTAAPTLEDAARLAVARARGENHGSPGIARREGAAPEDGLREAIASARARAGHLRAGQRAVRGLFSGGTLCQEAALLMRAAGVDHTAVDLGDDAFTAGRPHPMIDFRLRNERIAAAAEDPSTAVILLDVVLGHGAHPDPAAALAPAIERARATAAGAGRGLAVVASVCGTAADPQGLGAQEARLAAQGVILAPSNARAARLAAGLVDAGVRADG